PVLLTEPVAFPLRGLAGAALAVELALLFLLGVVEGLGLRAQLLELLGAGELLALPLQPVRDHAVELLLGGDRLELRRVVPVAVAIAIAAADHRGGGAVGPAPVRLSEDQHAG